MKSRIMLALMIMALAAAPVFSANMVANPSFEDPGYLGNTATWGLTQIGTPGWSIFSPGGSASVGVLNAYQEGAFGGPGDPNPGPLVFTSSDGEQHVDLTGENNQGNVSIRQFIPTVIGQSYTLTFDLGNLGLGGNSSICLDSGCVSTVDDYMESARVLLFVGNGAFDNDMTTYDNSLAGSGREVNWQSQSYTFTAEYDWTFVSFENANVGARGNDNYVGIDNVYMDLASPSEVPEPGTIAFMGGGLLAVGLLRSRLRKS